MHCFASKGVMPSEAKVTELLEFISLDNIEEWKERILNVSIVRNDVREEIEQKGYSINKTVDLLEKLYYK